MRDVEHEGDRVPWGLDNDIGRFELVSNDWPHQGNGLPEGKRTRVAIV
jgi:hypothetical protein